MYTTSSCGICFKKQFQVSRFKFRELTTCECHPERSSGLAAAKSRDLGFRSKPALSGVEGASGRPVEVDELALVIPSMKREESLCCSAVQLAVPQLPDFQLCTGHCALG